jgi:asparagine synthase (glutamine-hydrolysing)
MCGFYGAYTSHVQSRHRRHTSLNHRGPDSQKEWSDGHLYLKHYRLSILGGEAGNQPLLSRSGRTLVVTNGEIYNYRELAVQMGQPELAEEGDTRVFTEFVERYGWERTNQLNGMFAALVYDTTSRQIFFLRDRLGIKPLYHSLQNGTLYFASEIKALPGKKSLSEGAVKEYLAFGSYPSGKDTFFKDIHQFAPAAVTEFKGSRLITRPYYDLERSVSSLSESKLALEEYEALIENSIQLRLRSDVPISLHFSGGTDSLALLLKTKEVWGWNYPLITYTMAFNKSAYDESLIASRYARELKVENRKVFLSAAEVPALAVRMQHFQDEPFGGIPTIAYFKMNATERQHGYLVSIEGQGGDEALGGYNSHIFLAILDLYESGDDPVLLATLVSFTGVNLEEVIIKARRYISSGFNAHTDLTDFRESVRRIKKRGSWLRTIQLHDVLRGKIPRTLRFNDRASAATGREVRFPLLDYRVLEYGLALDHSTKYAEGVSKYPLRRIIRKYLKHAYSVPKRAVVTPQTRWLKHELRDWASSHIDRLQRRHVVDQKYFSSAREFFISKNSENSFHVWQLVNLDLLLEHSLSPRNSANVHSKRL